MQKRLEIIDGIRGLVIISMVAYHTCWDLVFMKGVDLPFYTGRVGWLWQQSICCSFILLSGFCVGLGCRPIRRGLLVSAMGMLVSAVTFLFAYEERILFGVLTFIGSAMLFLGSTKGLWEKVPAVMGIVFSVVLFLMFYPVNQGYLAVPGSRIYLPESWYANNLTTFVGFMKPGFFSTDYFSFLPWIFLFLVGFFGYRMMERYAGFSALQKGRVAPIEWLGRHSLLIYLLHQPVISAILLLVRV